MNGFEFFDNIYYINLASRTDRDLATRYELMRLDIAAKRIEAETGEIKWMAFNESQFKALSQAEGERVLILEDDIVFRNVSSLTGSHLPEAIKELPEDWDMLFLGANTIGSDVLPFEVPAPYSKHLNRITNSWATHAVAYSRKCIDEILEIWKHDEYPIYDEFLRVNILPVKKCFVLNPMIADQRDGFSDIWQTPVQNGFFNQGNERMAL